MVSPQGVKSTLSSQSTWTWASTNRQPLSTTQLKLLQPRVESSYLDCSRRRNQWPPHSHRKGIGILPVVFVNYIYSDVTGDWWLVHVLGIFWVVFFYDFHSEPSPDGLGLGLESIFTGTLGLQLINNWWKKGLNNYKVQLFWSQRKSRTFQENKSIKTDPFTL